MVIFLIDHIIISFQNIQLIWKIRSDDVSERHLNDVHQNLEQDTFTAGFARIYLGKLSNHFDIAIILDIGLL